MPKAAYYLEDYTDEVMPCGPSLADWAEWLSKPDDEWGRDHPANDGDVFKAYVYEIHQVSAVRRDGLWVLEPAPPPNTEWLALRMSDNGGWFAEDVASNIDDLQQIIEGEISAHPDGAYFIACGVPAPSVTLEFCGGQLSPRQ